MTPGFLERHFHGLLGALIVLAGFSRAALLFEFINSNPFSEVLYSDAWVYWYMSALKAGGQWIEQTPFLQAPLYPNLLAVCRYLGFSIGAIAAIQAVINLATIYLLATLTHRRFGAAAGLLAATMLALSLEPTIATTQILATTLQVFLVTLVLWSWIRCSERRTVRNAALTGVCTGLLALAWPPGQLLLPLLAIWVLAYFRPLRNALGAAAVGLCSGLLIVSPASVHNYYVDKDFSLVSANGGINLYFGNNPNAQGIIAAAPGIRVERESMFADVARVYVTETGGRGSWADMDRFYRQKALDYWRSDPLNAVILFGRKLYWVLVSADYDNTGVTALHRELGLFGFAWLTPLQITWFMGLGLLGFLYLGRQPLRYAPELVLVTLPVLICVVFYFSGRYRLPMLPPLCVLAAVGVTRWRQLVRPPPLRWLLALVPALLLLIESHLRLVDVDFDRPATALRVAHAYIERGDLRVIAGEFDKARADYLAATSIDPSYALAPVRLAQLAAKTGAKEELERWSAQALTVDSDAVDVLVMQYGALAAAEDWPAAAQVLTRASKIAPADLGIQRGLLWLLVAGPDEALRDPREGLRRAARLVREGDSAFRAEIRLAMAAAQYQLGLHDHAQISIEQARRMLDAAADASLRKRSEAISAAIRSLGDLPDVIPELSPKDPWSGQSHPMLRAGFPPSE